MNVLSTNTLHKKNWVHAFFYDQLEHSQDMERCGKMLLPNKNHYIFYN